ncbi:MAG TPA: hydroxymethylbilane synthase [Legionella sp.]|nr:hydroxymethylbilane synthase [Legionella sp.]
MPQQKLRIATRKSPLALWQAEHIRAALLHHWPDLHVELLPMVTSGDAFLKEALLTIGGKGLFVKELEDALLDKRADLAVHSMKDVPTLFPDGLSLAAICQRDNPFDALVSPVYSCLNTLPLGARIGTTSLRRQSQLLAYRPDVQMLPLRGNIHTRLAKLDQHDFDAIVLAVAGLERMGMQERIAQVLPDDIMLPACGQGALGLECRTDDDAVLRLIAPLNDAQSALSVRTERRVNALLGGNCHVPIAIYCALDDDSTRLVLRAKVATPNGKTILRNTQRGNPEDAMAMAERCAQTLLDEGATELLAKL